MSQTIDQEAALAPPTKTAQPGPARLGLVGDIGGTHARFALAAVTEDGRVSVKAPKVYLHRDHVSAEDAARTYLEDCAGVLPRPVAAAIAVAGPPIDGRIVFTNIDWTITETEFSRTLGLESTSLVNDFAALAMSAPLLGSDDLKTVGPEIPGRDTAPIALLGAGTGLGVSCFARDGAAEAVLSTEGGHMSLAPVDERQVEIWRWLARKFGRVSVERVLSGPGLLNLHDALVDILGTASDCATPADVSLAAGKGNAVAQAARHEFCAFLGAFAGDVALAYGALGGVYLGGGLTQHFMDLLESGLFRERFEAKGRFEAYLKTVPTRVVLHPHACALLGAARSLQKAGVLA